MALRLAGEQLGALRGVDSAGWLREVTTSDALAGLRVDQLGTGRIVDFQDGGASKLHVLDGGRVVVADSVEIGGAPATLGAVRLANAAVITARNAGNTADLPVVTLDSGNIVHLGNDASSGIKLGQTAQVAAVLHPATGLLPLNDAEAPLGSTAKRYVRGVFSESLQVGTNPALTGAIRLANGQRVSSRNAANTTDIPLLELTSGNVIHLSSLGYSVRIGDVDCSIGFFGTAAVTRRTSAADLTNNVTAGGVNDTIANYTDLATYANDAAAIRNNIYQLARQLKQINDGLRAYGLFG